MWFCVGSLFHRFVRPFDVWPFRLARLISDSTSEEEKARDAALFLGSEHKCCFDPGFGWHIRQKVVANSSHACFTCCVSGYVPSSWLAHDLSVICWCRKGPDPDRVRVHVWVRMFLFGCWCKNRVQLCPFAAVQSSIVWCHDESKYV
jgi:hypothetical protein